MRISDWSSDVCSSDLVQLDRRAAIADLHHFPGIFRGQQKLALIPMVDPVGADEEKILAVLAADHRIAAAHHPGKQRSEEHTSELQSLMRISYAVFCLKNKKTPNDKSSIDITIHQTIILTI